MGGGGGGYQYLILCKKIDEYWIFLITYSRSIYQSIAVALNDVRILKIICVSLKPGTNSPPSIIFIY